MARLLGGVDRLQRGEARIRGGGVPRPSSSSSLNITRLTFMCIKM
jgi:hypothetical protein